MRVIIFIFRIWRLTAKRGRIPVDGIEWYMLKSFVLMRDNYTCRRCRRRARFSRDVWGGAFHVDHIIPVSRGGSNRLGNLQTLCADCHRAKHPWIKPRRRGR